jgi:hypothetical protein
MKIEIIEGLDERVYQYISPFAMDLKFIKANGNPIVTSKLHKWFIGFEKDDLLCFCSVKYALSVKNMQIGNYFNIRGKKGSQLIKKVIQVYTREKQLGLSAFSNNEQLKMFRKLGFEITKEGKNWHRIKYQKK